MTDTEITSLHPFQDELPCLKADQRLAHELNAPLDKRDSFIQGEPTHVKPEFNAIVSSPCPSLSTIASSPSMRTSRVSLPSIWSNSSSDSPMLDSSCLSSAAPLWSYSFCDIPLSPTETTCGFQTSPSLRNIWGSPAENHHQRRMSLSDDRLVPETHTAKRNSDQVNGFGRRHSVAGPFMPKTPNRWMQDYRSPYPNDMKPIDEDDMFYANTHYSRYQQHILNKGILDHIDEYFGGNNKDASAGPQVRPTLPPQTTPPDPGFGKTMTAGGDALTFGSSELLMGKGIPLHHFLDSNTLLYLVKFKTNRTDICYIMQGDAILPQMSDLVITEADRGRDLGRVINILTANTILQQQQKQPLDLSMEDDDDEGRLDEPVSQQKCQVKRLYRLANAEETASLTTKQLDEEKALLICQAKIQQKKLPMQVVSAEYQWDRRKLTFYFMADQRIDFRELVRELFKTYKTRIWMCALKSNANNKLAGL